MGGKFIVKAKQHIFESGQNVSLKIPTLPVLVKQPYSAAFIFLDAAKQPMVNYKYKLVSETGEIVEGITDEFGKTQAIQTLNRAEVSTYIADLPVVEEIDTTMPLLNTTYEDLFHTDDPNDQLDDVDFDIDDDMEEEH